MTYRPHDALFKAAFGAPRDAAAFLQCVLPEAAVLAIDWTTVAREEGSFVDTDLSDVHSDVLFSARLHEGTAVLLYALIEHQSRVDADMPLRMLGYEVRIWERFRTRAPRGPRPIIIPLVLAHAPDGWTEPTTFSALFVPAPSELGIARHVPELTITVIDLAHRTDAEIKAWSLGTFQKLALWLMRDVRDGTRFRASIPSWALLLRDAHDAAVRAPHGMRAFAQLLHYIWHVAGEVPFRDFRARILEQVPDAQEAVMTIAEELKNEGRAEGLAQGLAEGRTQGLAQTLRRLLVLKFGPLDSEIEARLGSATSDQLDRWLERLLTASSAAATVDD